MIRQYENQFFNFHIGKNYLKRQNNYLIISMDKIAKGDNHKNIYYDLQDLVEKYNIKLTQNYTLDSDPLEMKEEYLRHKEICLKNNQKKLCKQILFNYIIIREFLDEKFVQKKIEK